MVAMIGIMDSTTILKEVSKMNEIMEDSLYDVLDKLPTKLVQLYYVNSWELDDQDGMRVSGNILYARNYYETA